MKTVTKMLSAVAMCAALAVAGASSPALAQQKPLTYKVWNTSAGSLHANMTIIMGEKDAILVDTPFLRSDAYRLAAEILETGKTLKYIVISHAHPDHLFGASVLKEVFPDAQVIAQAKVVDEAWAGTRGRYDYWAPQIGALAPQKFVFPQVYKDATINLEGREIQLIGPLQGDAENSTLVYVPSLKLVATSDVTFNQVHVYWGGETRAQRDAWLRTLDRVASLNPDIVIAGHAKPGTPNNMSAVTYTRAYLNRVNSAIAEIKTAADYTTIMKRDFPQAMDFQGDFILNASAGSALEQHNAAAK